MKVYGTVQVHLKQRRGPFGGDVTEQGVWRDGDKRDDG
jgi:hypothetical protein